MWTITHTHPVHLSAGFTGSTVFAHTKAEKFTDHISTKRKLQFVIIYKNSYDRKNAVVKLMLSIHIKTSFSEVVD